MSTATDTTIGPRFFEAQDLLRGGPADELCADRYLAYIGANPPIDLDGHKGFAAMFYSAFPDLEHTVEDTIAEEDKVVVRFTLRGTHTGDFMGIPATRKPIDISAIAILKVDEGKVLELRAIFDQMKMMQQLGVLPG